MDFDLTEERFMKRQTARDFAEEEDHPNIPATGRRGAFALGDLDEKRPPRLPGDTHFLAVSRHEPGRPQLHRLHRGDRRGWLALGLHQSVHITTVGKTLDRRGTSKQKRRHLPRICCGEILAYFAATSTAAFN